MRNAPFPRAGASVMNFATTRLGAKAEITERVPEGIDSGINPSFPQGSLSSRHILGDGSVPERSEPVPDTTDGLDPAYFVPVALSIVVVILSLIALFVASIWGSR